MARSSQVLADIFKGALLFSFAGPPIGALCFLATSMGRGSAHPGALLWLVLAVAYAFTLPVAAVTGLVAGVVRERLDRLEACLVTSVTGALITALYILCLSTNANTPTTALVFSGYALVAAAGCSAIFFRKGGAQASLQDKG